MNHGKNKWITIITYQLIPERGAKRPQPIKEKNNSKLHSLL